MGRIITKLDSLQTAELSLVRRGANNRRFAVTKGMTNMDVSEVLQSVLATEAEGEQAVIATLKSAGLEGDALDVAVAHYRLQNGFADKVDAEAFGTVAKAAGYLVEKTAPKPEKKEPEKKASDSVSHKPAGMPEEMEKVWKSQQDEIAALRAENETNRAELESVKKAAQRRDYVAKCEREYAHVPGMSSEEMADMLIQAESVSKSFAESLEKQWRETAEAVKKSALLRSSGSRGSDANGGDAWSRMESMAKERVEKSAGKIDMAAAVEAVMAENPSLYEEYLAENPAQRARS